MNGLNKYHLIPSPKNRVLLLNEKAGFGEKEDGSRNELEGLSTGLVLILFSVLAFLRKGQSLTPACSFQELSLM